MVSHGLRTLGNEIYPLPQFVFFWDLSLIGTGADSNHIYRLLVPNYSVVKDIYVP